jgi:hypothetical protein
MISGEKKSGRPTKSERMRESKRPGDRDAYEERLRYELKFLSYAPIVFISAQTGKGTEKIFPLLQEVAAERRKRVTTSEMNRFLEHVDFERASVPMRQRVKILYMTQASVAPPTFVLFTNRAVKLHFAYQRFLENQIRAAFGFMGTPIWIKNRARVTQNQVGFESIHYRCQHRCNRFFFAALSAKASANAHRKARAFHRSARRIFRQFPRQQVDLELHAGDVSFFRATLKAA